MITFASVMENERQEDEHAAKSASRLVSFFRERYGELLSDMMRCLSYLKEWALSSGWMQTYYGSTRKYTNCLKRRYGLTEDENRRALAVGFAAVMRKKGEEWKVTLTAIGRILLRALFAAVVSLVCDLPPVNLRWFPLAVVAMMVDIVFFQRQVFLVIQELELLYVGRDRKDSEFEKMEAEFDRLQTGGGKLLSWLGTLIKWVSSYVARVFRKSLRIAIVQIFRVIGVRAGGQMVDSTTTFVVVYGVSSFIAGVTSYVLFVLVAWRMRNKLYHNELAVEADCQTTRA